MKNLNIPQNWREGRDFGSIIADASPSFPYVAGYGGHVICESASPRYRPLIVAAPEMLELCKTSLVMLEEEYEGTPLANGPHIRKLREVIERISR